MELKFSKCDNYEKYCKLIKLTKMRVLMLLRLVSFTICLLHVFVMLTSA